MRAEQGRGGNGRTLKRAMAAAVYCVEAVVSALVVMGGGWRRVAMRPCHCAESIGPRRLLARLTRQGFSPALWMDGVEA